MEKKFYMPSMNDLYIMQEMGANVYKYLTVKAIESLIIDGINNPDKGILKSAYKYLSNDLDIASAICSLYPDEVQYSDIAKYDVNLCYQLLVNNTDTSIYQLDNISHFSISTLSNLLIQRTAVNILNEELPSCPKYRFEYKNNKLLDDIFSTKFSNSGLYAYLYNIEPAYVLKDVKESGYNTHNSNENLISSINNYANRYGINSDLHVDSVGSDILTNPSVNVKRLIKCINKNKNNLY